MLKIKILETESRLRKQRTLEMPRLQICGLNCPHAFEMDMCDSLVSRTRKQCCFCSKQMDRIVNFVTAAAFFSLLFLQSLKTSAMKKKGFVFWFSCQLLHKKWFFDPSLFCVNDISNSGISFSWPFLLRSIFIRVPEESRWGA